MPSLKIGKPITPLVNWPLLFIGLVLVSSYAMGVLLWNVAHHAPAPAVLTDREAVQQCENIDPRQITDQARLLEQRDICNQALNALLNVVDRD